MDYVRNRWYPLTWSRDVGRGLIKRKIVGENLVLYRTLDGDVVALRDACPHRLLLRLQLLMKKIIFHDLLKP